MDAQTTSETVYYIWFFILLFFLLLLFVAKLKFNSIYEKREERRRMLNYSRIKLSPSEDGQRRALRIRKLKEFR